jgi:hypothetical protein
MTHINYLLDHIKVENFFTKFDLAARYHQVHMIVSDTWKITFKTMFGLYEWLVMPFGLTNDPTNFELLNENFSLTWAILL